MSEQGPHQRPMPRSGARRATRGERIVGALLALGCLSVLVIAAWLHADTNGHGTHTQLGLSECAWAEYFEAPCATCGMTTSFAYAADGRWLSSLLAQPFGALLTVLTSIVFWGGLHISATGSRLGAAVGPAISTRALVIGTVLFLAAWAFKWAVW